MKVYVLCFVLLFLGFVSGVVVEKQQTILVSILLGTVGAIGVRIIGGYLKGRMK